MYKIYMDDVLLPIAPQKITHKVKNRNETKTLINEGEINILKSAGLATISFTALLPNSEYPFAVFENGFKNPFYFIEHFRKLKNEAAPFVLDIIRVNDSGERIYSNSSSDENTSSNSLRVTLENYTINDDAEEGEDISVDIELKTWVDYSTKFVTIDNGKVTVINAKPLSTVPATYTTVAGDTLCSIAKVQLGSDTLWENIYNLNSDYIEKTAKANGHESSLHGGYIFPGMTLKLK